MVDTPFGELPDRHVAQMSMADRHDRLITRRRFVALAAVAGTGVAIGGPILWRQSSDGSVPAQAPHLQFGADPRQSMVVSWSTPGNVDGAAVDFGLDPSFGTRIEADSRPVAGTDTAYHHAALTALAPDTTYHYRVRHHGHLGAPLALRTAPPTPERFSFTAFGDQGVGRAAHAVLGQVAELQPDFHLHLGDLCYADANGTGAPGPVDSNRWDEWLRLISGVASGTPWMPAVGNHEMESGFGPQGYDGVLARFSLPPNGARGVPVTYSFVYGNVGIVALDGNDVSGELTHNRGYTRGEQTKWLRSLLSQWRADDDLDFVIAGFHHCMYCSAAQHGSDLGARTDWGPIFDEFEVDVVLNGHNHCYERSHALRGGEVVEEVEPDGAVATGTGTLYFTAGGGGQELTAFLPPGQAVVVDEELGRVPERSVWSARRERTHSVLAFDVTPRFAPIGAQLKIRALRPDGSEIEQVTVFR